MPALDQLDAYCLALMLIGALLLLWPERK